MSNIWQVPGIKNVFRIFSKFQKDLLAIINTQGTSFLLTSTLPNFILKLLTKLTMRTTNVIQKQAQAKKRQHADRYCLARPINGISLNGNEYLLDDDNEIMWFDSDYDAYKFCFDNMTGLLLPNLDEEKYKDQDFTFLYHKLEEHGIYITHESEVQNDIE